MSASMALTAALTLTLLMSASLLVAPLGHAAGGGDRGGDFKGGGSGPNPNQTFQEGLDSLRAGDCTKANRRFKAVLKVASNSAEANYFRGLALQCLERYGPAAKFLRRAIKYDRSMYQAYAQLGHIYLELEKFDPAEKQLLELIKIRRDCADDCPPNLSSELERLRLAIRPEANKTEKDSEKAPKDGKQHSLLFEPVSEPGRSYSTAVQEINRGEFEAAIARLRGLTRAIGPVPDVLNYLGYTHRRLGRFQQSLEYYLQALAIDPLHRGANEYLGELYVGLGKIDLARERLAVLDQVCPFGCAEFEDLKRQIEARLVAGR